MTALAPQTAKADLIACNTGLPRIAAARLSLSYKTTPLNDEIAAGLSKRICARGLQEHTANDMFRQALSSIIQQFKKGS